MRNKLLVALLLVCLPLALLPTLAQAAVPTTVIVANTEVIGGGYWKINFEGNLIAGDATDYNVYYQPGPATLTLNGTVTLNGTTDSYADRWCAGVYADGDITLTLAEGANVTVQGADFNASNTHGTRGLYISGNLSVNGTGRLAVKPGTLHGSALSNTIYEVCGIRVEGIFTLRGGTVEAVAGDTNDCTTGRMGVWVDDLAVYGGSLVSNAGSINYRIENGYNGVMETIGIRIDGNLMLVDGGSVTATAGSVPSVTGALSGSCGIRTPSLGLTGGSVTAHGGVADESYGIDITHQLFVQNASLVADAAQSPASETVAAINPQAQCILDGSFVWRDGSAALWRTDTYSPASRVYTAIKPAPLTFTDQPQDVTVTERWTAGFSVSTNPDPNAYLWQQSADDGATWRDVGSGGNRAYAATAVRKDMNGYQYRCVVTIGGDSIASNAATLSVIVPSAAIGDVTVSGGTNRALTPVDATLTLTNVKFAALAADADVSGWFTNLPAGLAARVKTAVAEGAAAATVTFSGTPTAEDASAMEITIPQSYLVKCVDLAVAANPDAKWAIAVPAVTGVTVAPAAASVMKGGKRTFAATVAGTHNPDRTVTWTVEGNTSAATVIDANGELTVGGDERAKTLTVRATSAVDTAKSGTALVRVVSPVIPKTGDSAAPGLWLGLMLAAMGLATCAARCRGKRSAENK